MSSKRVIGVLVSALLVVASVACRAPVPPPPSPVYSVYQLEYRLMSDFGNFFWCDPDFYPIAREGQEQANAVQQFPAIMGNTSEFAAILEYLGLPNKNAYTDDEKLSVYREHKKLTYVVQMTASGDLYQFTLRVGQGQGQRIEGTISKSGDIKVLKRETSFNTCPICLSVGTLIDTPAGTVPVERLERGMAVWTADEVGQRIEVTIVDVGSTRVPPSFQMVEVTLQDGRSVKASPGHPSATGKALGDFKVGDNLDGSGVALVEYVVYDGGATYDLLPSGTTGTYWANGVLLESTLLGR